MLKLLETLTGAPSKGGTWAPRKAEATEPITRRVNADLNGSHVKNFLECMKTRKSPNSDVVSGHRSALASHLGKTAYLKGRRIAFNPADEKAYT